jgi:hypothetical protein
VSPRQDKPHGCPDPDWCGEGCFWDCQADPDATTNDHPRNPPWRHPTPEQWAAQRAKEAKR